MVTVLHSTTILIIWLITGIFFGLTASIYGAALRAYRIGAFVHVLDSLWFAAAAVVTGGVVIATTWGVFRAWTLLFLIIGYLLWASLAGPLVHRLFYFLFFRQARLVKSVSALVKTPFRLLSHHLPGMAKTVRRRLPSHLHLGTIRSRRKPPRK
ncbi:MAG: hypothetical protein M1600_13815 [Firmicutes bacterium]|jgi:hypothetical protein|nr:hypothetical protein [Bacillota bacterium]